MERTATKREVYLQRKRFKELNAKIEIQIDDENIETQRILLESRPQRKAYFFEKLQGLATRMEHYLTKLYHDSKDRTSIEIIRQLQKEWMILNYARPDWSDQFTTDELHQYLLTEY